MAHDSLLIDFLIVLAVSIPVIIVFHRLKLPSIVCFLSTGVIVGPAGAGLVKDVEAVRALAEIGVILLLFTIGIEFSIQQLLAAGSKLLFVTVVQIVLTTLATV